MAAKNHNQVITTILTAVLVFANLVVLNMLLRKVTWRQDLTEGKRHEIGEGTQSILSKLEDKVSVKCYFSSNLPKRFFQTERATIEKLQEYERLSEGKLIFEFVDPETDEAAAQELKDMAVVAAQVEDFESSTSKFVTSHMAMVFRYGYRKTTLNIFREMQHRIEDPAEYAASLEYYITSNIQKVSTDRRTVGLLAKISEVPANRFQPQGPKRKTQGIENLKGWLERHYDIKMLDSEEVNKGQRIPEEVNTLLVWRPEGFTDSGKYVLDQFICGGGNALFLVDNGTADISPKQKRTQVGRTQVQDFDLPTYAGTIMEHGLGDLLEHYGVRVEAEFVEDHSCLEFQYVKDKKMVQNPLTRQVGAQPITDFSDYYSWPVVPARDKDGNIMDRDQVNSSRAMVSGLKDLIFTWVSPTTVLEENLANHEGTSEVLIRSGPESWSRQIKENSLTPNPVSRYDSPERAAKPLALLVTGRFRSFFKDKDVPAPLGADGKPQPAPETEIALRLDRRKDEGTLFVCGDADFVSDGYLQAIMQLEMRKSRNRERAQSKPREMLAFVNHAVDVLTYGGDAGDLIAIKNKRVKSRELVKLEKEDSRKTKAIAVNLAVVPMLVIILGVIRFVLRAARNKSEDRPPVTPAAA